MAQGSTGTNSKRPSAYIEGVSPTHAVRGEGCYFWDESGKKYLDMVGALGACLLGYRHPKVTEAVGRALLTGGPSFSLPHPLEVEVAEIVCDMFNLEKVRFLKNGDDATCAAVRWARAASGKRWILSDGYHGRSDIWTSLTEPAKGIEDVHAIMGLKTAEMALQGDLPPNFWDNIGAVIVEPLRLSIMESKDVFKSDFWNHGLRGFRIFDEIITGGRVPKWSVASWWNLKPDLMCLGKGLANGFPLSVVGGRAEIMDIPEVFISSTFSGENISLAAAKATLLFLQAADVTDLWYYANRFMDSVNKIIAPLDLKIEGYGTRGMFPVDKPNSGLFMQECHKAGIFIGKAWFYGFAHMEHSEELTLNLLVDIVSKIQRGDVKMEGKLPTQTFKR